MQHIGLRGFLIVVLIILIAMAIALSYLYYIVSKPPGDSAYQTKSMQHVLSIYGFGISESEQLYRPSDVAFDNQGNIYVTDTGHSRILSFDLKGNFLREIGVKGTGKGEIMEPIGITVADDGRIYVSDKVLNKIVIFAPAGNPLSEIRVTAPLKPLIADNKLYLTTRDHIMVYSLAGRPTASWGQKGRDQGYMDSPLGIAVGKDASVYISDTLNLRVESFTNYGKLRWVVGQPAKDIKASDRKFGLPSGIAIDNKNRIYMVDAFKNNITVFDASGRQITTLGRNGDRDGEFNLPAGIAFDQGGVFAIADRYNNRIQLLKIILN